MPSLTAGSCPSPPGHEPFNGKRPSSQISRTLEEFLIPSSTSLVMAGVVRSLVDLSPGSSLVDLFRVKSFDSTPGEGNSERAIIIHSETNTTSNRKTRELAPSELNAAIVGIAISLGIIATSREVCFRIALFERFVQQHRFTRTRQKKRSIF